MNKTINKIRTRIHIYICLIRGFLKGLAPNISIGKRLICESNVVISTYEGGTVKIGSQCELRSGCKILSYGGNITIGDYCSLNPYTMVYGQGNLSIGNYVRIATQCVLIPSNHNFQSCEVPIYTQGLTNKGIIIEDDVWLGAGVKVLDGVTIAKGCVIGAGSVVTKSTEPYGIYVGVPAKFIKRRK